MTQQMKLINLSKGWLGCFAFIAVFAVLSYINFFFVIGFDLEQLPDNYLPLLVYDLLYMGMLTAILILSRPFSQSNHRELILLFLFTAFIEYVLYVRLVYWFIDYFYIAIWFNSLLSFLSYYLVSKRERLSLWGLSHLLGFNLTRQWASAKIATVYLTDFDGYICRVLFIIFIANLLGDAMCAGYAWYLQVPWFDGSLAENIDNGAFDVYLLSEVVVNGLILILMGYIILKLKLAANNLTQKRRTMLSHY